MKFLTSLILSVLLSITFSNVQAAIGCLSSNTTYTYINPEGMMRQGVPSYYHRYESDRKLSDETYCAVNMGSPCYIYATRSGYSSSPGTLVSYSPVNNCGIDSYSNLLLVAFATVGFFYIKKERVLV